MKTIEAQVRGGVLEVLAIPKDVRLKVTEYDNGEVYEVVRNAKTGEPEEVRLKTFEPMG